MRAPPGLVIALGASLWGLYWLPVRSIEEAGVDGVWAVALFNAPAALAALVVFALRPGRGGRAALLAGAAAGLGLALYALGFVFTTVVKATLLFYLTPVWSTLIAMAALGERPGAARWTALAMAAAGLLLILGPGALSGGFGLGEAFGLGSGIAWSVATVLVRRSGAAGSDLIVMQFVALICAAGVAAAALQAAPPSLSAATAALEPWIVALSLAILASTYAIFWAVAQVSPGRSGLLMMTEVVVAVVTAAILLPEEALTAREWLGAALIVGASVAETRGGAPPAAARA
ncbi:MAG: DMT family transporter [Pseudomonadota bacterium]